MKPICVFYHCILVGHERHIDPDYAFALITDQMRVLKESGLADNASAIYVCVNGSEADALAVSTLVPDKTVMICHGAQAQTEIPTMNIIRDWTRGHPDWYVLYHHTKGVSTPAQADGWRRRMQEHCVQNWQRCVSDLDRGFDLAGCHWLTPEQNRGVISSPFFGGTFWWATTRYLSRLPGLPSPEWKNRYEAESWIGRSGQYRAKVSDYSPGWPTPN